MAERKYTFMKPKGVKADAADAPKPSTSAGAASPQSGGLTGAKMMKERPISPKAAKRYSDKGVGRMAR